MPNWKPGESLYENTNVSNVFVAAGVTLPTTRHDLGLEQPLDLRARDQELLTSFFAFVLARPDVHSHMHVFFFFFFFFLYIYFFFLAFFYGFIDRAAEDRTGNRERERGSDTQQRDPGREPNPGPLQSPGTWDTHPTHWAKRRPHVHVWSAIRETGETLLIWDGCDDIKILLGRKRHSAYLLGSTESFAVQLMWKRESKPMLHQWTTGILWTW